MKTPLGIRDDIKMSASSDEDASWPVSIQLVNCYILIFLGYIFKEPEDLAGIGSYICSSDLLQYVCYSGHLLCFADSLTREIGHPTYYESDILGRRSKEMKS